MSEPPARFRDDPGYQFPGSELTDAEVEFGQAMHAYQLRHGIRYPAWSDVLFVLRTLGYRKPESGGGLTTEAQRRRENPERVDC